MSRIPTAWKACAAAALALALSGCGGFSWNPLDWFARSPPPPPAPLVPIANPLPTQTLWQASIGRTGLGVFTPALAGGHVYAAAEDGTVAKLDAASGKQVWRTRIAATLTGGVGADGSLVVVGSSEGEVIGLDDAGVLRWRARVSSEVLAAPVVAGDLVVVRSTDNRIFGLDARDGRRRWVFQRAAPALAVRSTAGAVIKGGYVFAGFSGGKLVALSVANGGLRWEGTVSLPKGTTELERVSDVIGLPWIGEREACAVAFQGRVACFDLGNGNQLWARDMSSSSGLDVDARAVYVSEDRGAVAALSRQSGTSVWRQDRLANRRLTAPLAVGRQIAVGDLQGFVHLIGEDTGAFVGRLATDGSAIVSPPVAIPGGFVVQTSSGGLYAFSTK